jgi:hypothetical protein
MTLSALLYALGPALFRRPELNHPPTAVGGISEFPVARCAKFILTRPVEASTWAGLVSKGNPD